MRNSVELLYSVIEALEKTTAGWEAVLSDLLLFAPRVAAVMMRQEV